MLYVNKRKMFSHDMKPEDIQFIKDNPSDIKDVGRTIEKYLDEVTTALKWLKRIEKENASVMTEIASDLNPSMFAHFSNPQFWGHATMGQLTETLHMCASLDAIFKEAPISVNIREEREDTEDMDILTKEIESFVQKVRSRCAFEDLKT